MRPILLVIAFAVAAFAQVNSPIADLNRRLESGQARLTFEPTTGYLRSVLDALGVPVQSQIVVFSKTSLMKSIITPQNPRAIYFNDTVAVGWVRGEPFVEVATADPSEGIVFYVVDQRPTGAPLLRRDNFCRTCHETFSTLPMPRLIVRSVFPGVDGTPIRGLGEFEPGDRSPFHERWGGWYVTGNAGLKPHLGNTVVMDETRRPALSKSRLDSLSGKFDTASYLASSSDVVALLVFEHQMRLLNQLSRVSLDVRAAAGNPTDLIRDGASEIADALLFAGAVPLAGPIEGGSGFAEVFTGLGPRDSEGRSLRQFDLRTRLLRYSCSYLIYSAAFDSLPPAVRDAVYARLWKILSGEDRNPKYSYLTITQRRAIVEILRETRKGLPEWFQPVIR